MYLLAFLCSPLAVFFWKARTGNTEHNPDYAWMVPGIVHAVIIVKDEMLKQVKLMNRMNMRQ
ncbi:hypothetical protein ERICI_01137 [Paenibacillus larvae subsp. larvae]|nr:hypothetical protein BXP28_11370 [Paenibacillus larvae subsp. larvae]AVF21039.1 hypothetical protein ERICI_01137 [Paenibacillus larvae subsp. larvae]ETK27899.1 hypothetical protein ERIC1_1c13540 [Paenibacillus larvae subsp. larvae DSM 25719]